MNLKAPRRLPQNCPDPRCPTQEAGPQSSLLVRRGFYFRASDSRWIGRFLCRRCGHSFSQATGLSTFRQKKRTLNLPVQRLLTSGVSQRRAALIFGVNRKTIVRKFLFGATEAQKRHETFLKSLRDSTSSRPLAIQFDEMESFERSKCLPLSIPLVVLPESRKILAIDVCSMPAKGPLTTLSLRRYGPRRDERPKTAIRLLRSLRGSLAVVPEILSDQNPKYPGWLKQAFCGYLAPPSASSPQSFQAQFRHKTVKGRRGCVVGQGELKRGGHDPLFSLNHTAAMIRANVNRMFRRTWCTTKRADRLRAHLMLYVDFHNTVLTA